jgi:hypothetical protein
VAGNGSVLPAATDLVDPTSAASHRNQLRRIDITEHRTSEGKIYCAVADSFSCRVIDPVAVNGLPGRDLFAECPVH